MKKKCSHCKQEKETTEFWRSKCEKDGFQPHCKACILVWHKAWVAHNRKHVNELERIRRHSSDRAALSYRYWDMSQRRDVNFTRAELYQWYTEQNKECHYCKNPFSKIDGQTTIDRKDNSKPYTLENICLCCRRCNMVKSDALTEEQMMQVAKILMASTK
jgi:hypothetical protein